MYMDVNMCVCTYIFTYIYVLMEVCIYMYLPTYTVEIIKKGPKSFEFAIHTLPELQTVKQKSFLGMRARRGADGGRSFFLRAETEQEMFRWICALGTLYLSHTHTQHTCSRTSCSASMIYVGVCVCVCVRVRMYVKKM